jgi:hypothetical protein
MYVFNNPGLSGAPLFTRYHDQVEFNWGGGGPGSGLPNDNFAMRWSRSADFAAPGRYTFYARTDSPPLDCGPVRAAKVFG